MTRLLHLVNLRSANVGNGALILGTERILREDLLPEVQFERVAWDDYTFGLLPFDSRFVDRINASDGLLVNGAVTFNGRAYLQQTGSRFDLPLELWSKIKKPVIFYGLSHRFWPGQSYHHAERLRAMLQTIRQAEQMRMALRNDGTRDWLNETIGEQCAAGMPEIPDPALYVTAEPGGLYPEMQKGRFNLLLSFNDEDAEYRYAEPGMRNHVLQQLVAMVVRLSRVVDLNVVLVPHYFDDFQMVHDFIQACPPALAHQQMVASGLARLEGTGSFYGRYLQADAVIAMRVHAMSPAIGLGVPALFLVTQERMKQFLGNAGLSEWMVDFREPYLADRLVTTLLAIKADKERVRQRFLTARQEMREQSRLFNQSLAGLFGR
ncbi:MAG: polysaccharide pyruvyl transferase family protein [Magnetococcales bacterium]|nr:polysaccharide pyruvyl transferase family protein [Magnetococcales bacterium]